MKRDYLNDPNAPRANDLTPVVNVAVFSESGELLLLRRADNRYWALPGGFMEPGERLSDAAIRELREETGIEAELSGIVGIYSDPGHVTSFPDGKVHQQCTICFRGRHSSGLARTTSEATDVRWVSPSDIGTYSFHPTMELRILHALTSDNVYMG